MNLFSFVKSNLSILTVVGDYVSLKKAGIYHKGCCPLHGEKTASFTVSPHRDIFYCFGCQAGGDLIAFIAKIENCSQLEAAYHLIERYGLQVPETIKSARLPEQQAIDQKKRYFQLCQVVASWCHQQLLNCPEALTYLAGRGLSHESIRRHSLGYFVSGPGAMKEFARFCSQQGFLVEHLLEAHIVAQGKAGLYSPFQDRIMFPIRDHLGRHCGFGGRIFKPHDERAKYYNSRENQFFAKGSLLFGLDMAKKGMQETHQAYLVEGYMDCIAMVQYGLSNTVATLGTACSPDHLAMIARYAQELYVLYDGDQAGQKGILRLTELCWNVNLDLKIVSLDSDEDPASFLAKNGNIGKLIERAQDIFTFFIEKVGTHFKQKTLQEKLQLTRRLIDIIQAIEDPLKREILLQQATQVFGITFDMVSGGSGQKPQETVPLALDDGHTISKLEQKLCAAFLSDWELFDKYIYLKGYLAQPVQDILTCLMALRAAHKDANFGQFFDTLTMQQQQWVNRVLMQIDSHDLATDCQQLVDQFHKKHWKTIVNDVKIKLAQAHQEGDLLEEKKLLETFQELKKKIVTRGFDEK